VKHLGEIFQDTSSWPIDEQVHSFVTPLVLLYQLQYN
jgi:hypothetical protein